MTEMSTPRYSRRSQQLLLDVLFGHAQVEDLDHIEPLELASLSAYCQAEAHVLWRLESFVENGDVSSDRFNQLYRILKRRCMESAAWNMKLDQVGAEVCQRLTDNGIRVMLLKGTVLRARYPEIAGRPQGDTDIMVPGDKVLAAESLLVEMGFKVDESSLTREQYLNEHYDLRMARGGIPVEIHWTLSNQCPPGGIELIWKRAEVLKWRGIEVWIPGIPDSVAYTLIHICHHYFYEGLRWFGDLVLELERWPDVQSGLVEAASGWPPRMVAAPLVVAEDWGLANHFLPASSQGCMSPLDRAVLKGLARAAAFYEPYWGMPQYRLEDAFFDWLTRTDGSLPIQLLGGVAKRIWNRLH